MAKKSKTRVKRGVSNTANQRLLSTFSPFQRLPGQLDLFEDRRLFTPDPLPPAKSFNTPHHRLTIPKSKARSFSRPGPVPHQLGFAAPEKVLICVRRKIRKEVLHAYKRTGRGSGRPNRRGPFSDIHCR